MSKSKRVPEIELMKALAIVGMVFVHILEMSPCLTMKTEPARTASIIIDFFGGIISGGAFMFAMGWGAAYSDRATPKTYVRRFFVLLLLGLVVNLFQQWIPMLVAPDFYGSVRDKWYSIISIDIYAFAALSALYFALIKLLGKHNGLKIAVSLLLVAGTLCVNALIPPEHNVTGTGWIDTLRGLFIRENEYSYFPLVSWFVFPVAGLGFGLLYRHTKNRERLIAVTGIAGLAVTVITSVIMSRYRITNAVLFPYFATDSQYYALSNINILCGCGFLATEFALAHYIMKLTKGRLPGFLKNLSRNVMHIYISQWFFAGMLASFISHVDSVPFLILLSLLVLVAAYEYGIIASGVIAARKKKKAAAHPEHAPESDPEEPHRDKSLANRFLTQLFIMFAALMIATSAIIAYGVYRRMMDHYTQIATGCAHFVSNTVDGDRVAYYLATKDRDSYYNSVRQSMDEISDEFDLMYLYIYVPHNEYLTYVWAADDDGELIIGQNDVYSSAGREISERAFFSIPQTEIIRDHDEVYGDFIVACEPILNFRGEPVALVAADISTEKVHSSIRMEIYKILSTFSVILVIVSIFYFFSLRRRLILPILRVTGAAEEMVTGMADGKEISINVDTNDEIGTLARTFEKMNADLHTYIAENTRITSEKERISAELDMAQSIQAGQLPNVFPPFPERSDFDIFASMTPAKEVGGDFYDFFLIDDDHLAMTMADVSGKGVPAALFMMMSKILISNYAMMGLSPHEVLERTNETVCRHNQQEMFVTVWFGILEISTGKITAANAAHEYPIIRHPDGKFELFKDRHGFVIGGMDGMKYVEYEMTLEKGGTLFLYTDGVPEATDGELQMFGIERLLETLNSLPEGSAEELLTGVHEAVNTFVGEAPQFDDLTMLGITLT